MAERRDAVVVGGTGRVGVEVVRTLARERTFERVVACSRDPERARRTFADPRVDVARADVHAPLAGALFDRAAVVISCIEDPGVHVATECARRGIDYVDVTASLGRIDALEQLGPAATSSGARLVHGVGLAPGLTNLLVARACELDPDVRRARIVVSLGLGDDHGDAAIEWVLDEVGRSFTRGTARVRNFERAPDVRMLGEARTRGALALDFSDQHTLARARPGVDVGTDVTFDPPFVVPIARVLSSPAIGRLLAWQPLRARVSRALHRARFGPDTWALQVESHGRTHRVQHARGRAQSIATGRVAAHVAMTLARSGDAGVRSIEAIVSPMSAPALVASIGACFGETTSSP